MHNRDLSLAPGELFSKVAEADEIRNQETAAAILIQSWFRAERVREYIRHMHRCALRIQKNWKAHVDRQIYRRKVWEKLKAMSQAYYDEKAVKIQRRWRGYYTRKYIFDFAARKSYLEALQVTNEHVRKQLEEVKKQAILTKEREMIERQQADKVYNARKQHYMLSTEVSDGVFRRNPVKESELASVDPLSSQERETIERSKIIAFLNTSTGIPTPRQQEAILRGAKTPPLPPIKHEKPQGPFRNPQSTQRQRYKKLEPTLRVATDYESQNVARISMKADEWTKRVIDDKFLPSTKRHISYQPLLHSTSSFGSLAYGTKHFRDVDHGKSIQKEEFKKLVEPIPLFDQFGKTY